MVNNKPHQSSESRRWMRAAAVVLGVCGGAVNLILIASHWPQTRYEGVVPWMDRPQAVLFLATVLVLSCVGIVCAVLTPLLPRTSGLLLLIAAGIGVVLSVGAVFLWVFTAIYLVPGGVIQSCGGVLALMSWTPKRT